MQIVIDIPDRFVSNDVEDLYLRLHQSNDGIKIGATLNPTASAYGILEYTILSKGHGRLIDIEDASLLKTVECGGLSAKTLWRRINKQPTIIEADHGEENEQMYLTYIKG